MSGIQEILLVVLLILGLLILPRIIPSKGQTAKLAPSKVSGLRFSGKMRLAILLSLLWLFVFSAIYVPWQGQWLLFLYAGIGPLVFAWGLYWALKGFGNNRKR